MDFQWQTSPTEAFGALMKAYQQDILNRLYALMQQEAPLVEQFMRDNAPWIDNCMPGREYLKAFAWKDDDSFQVGITAYYDIDLYVQNCPEKPFDFGVAHETFTFPKAGVIAIILPRRPVTVLGDKADEIMDKVRALFA
jgi:hypothetical protein